MASQEKTHIELISRRFNYIYAGVFLLVMSTLSFWPHVKAFPWLEFLSRPLIMISLGIYYIINIPRNYTWQHLIFGIGLFFALLGDILSLFEHEIIYYFVIVCFMICQLSYTYVLYHERSGWIQKHPYVLLFFVFYALLLLSVLWSNLDQLKAIAIVYAFVILSMGAMAINRKGNVSQKSYVLVLSGSVLFIISDSLIAIDRYTYNLPYEGISIMSIYMIAQYSLVIGYLENQQSR